MSDIIEVRRRFAEGNADASAGLSDAGLLPEESVQAICAGKSPRFIISVSGGHLTEASVRLLEEQLPLFRNNQGTGLLLLEASEPGARITVQILDDGEPIPERVEAHENEGGLGLCVVCEHPMEDCVCVGAVP